MFNASLASLCTHTPITAPVCSRVAFPFCVLRSGTEKHDGCLIAYQSNAIARVVDVEQINYDDAHDRVALVVLLQWREPPPPGASPYVMLATTHLYWDAKRLSVQVNELDHLLTSIGRLQAKWSTVGEGGGVAPPIPTVIAGDFNNGPSSQVYARVVNHHSFLPLKPRTSSESSKAASSSPPPPPPRHWLYRYDSGYAASGKEPPCTSVTNRRCWTIDYIFYSQSATLLPLSSPLPTPPPPPHPLLRVTHTVPIPSESDLRAEAGPDGWNEDPRLKKAGQIGQGIPNSTQPSDHVPLLARFELVAPDRQQPLHMGAAEGGGGEASAI